MRALLLGTVLVTGCDQVSVVACPSHLGPELQIAQDYWGADQVHLDCRRPTVDLVVTEDTAPALGRAWPRQGGTNLIQLHPDILTFPELERGLIVAHEIGHVLHGRDHSDDPCDVMYPGRGWDYRCIAAQAGLGVDVAATEGPGTAIIDAD